MSKKLDTLLLRSTTQNTCVVECSSYVVCPHSLTTINRAVAAVDFDTPSTSAASLQLGSWQRGLEISAPWDRTQSRYHKNACARLGIICTGVATASELTICAPPFSGFKSLPLPQLSYQ